MQVLLTMGIAIIVLAGGYPIGGTLGDAWFKRNTRGRLLVSAIGVALGAIFLVFTLKTPVANQLQFGLLLGAHRPVHALRRAQHGGRRLRRDRAGGALHGQRGVQLLRLRSAPPSPPCWPV